MPISKDGKWEIKWEEETIEKGLKVIHFSARPIIDAEDLELFTEE